VSDLDTILADLDESVARLRRQPGGMTPAAEAIFKGLRGAFRHIHLGDEAGRIHRFDDRKAPAAEDGEPSPTP